MNNSVECKNIGIDWIGSIPSNWKVSRFKHLFDEKKSTKNPELNSGSISFGQVIYKDDQSIPESTKESYEEVLEGEFLINPLNLNYDLKSLRIALSRINVVVSQGYIILKLRDHLHPNYYEYLLRKFDVEHMKSLGQGVRQTISFTHLKDENLVVPPIEEQKLISRYLDKKTSQIDSLVERIRKKIELLKEQRTSLINHYVTKGLDPNVKMKDSGIDWIGEIPSHWETVQPKYKLNRVTRPIDDEDEVITCFRDGVVTLRKNRREDGFTNSVKEHGYQQIHPGDLVVHEMDGFAGAIGISDSKGKSTPVYTVVEPDDRADLKYIAYLLREMSQTEKIKSLARSIRERTTDFRWNMWSVINFPFPPIEEQKLISRYLDNKTSQINLLVEKIQKKIELLKEHRQSLISSVVTGKVRVTEDMI